MKRDEAENHSQKTKKKSTAAIQGIFCSDEGKTQKKEIAGRKEKRKMLLYPRKIALLKAFQYSYFSQ